jgi:Domain of unknown function (DUF4396)
MNTLHTHHPAHHPAHHAGHHGGHHNHGGHAHVNNALPVHSSAGGLTRIAFFATLHCLMGCAVGEVLGVVIGTALGWGNGATIALAVALAFVFGYAFTVVPLHHQGMPWRQATRLALAADTASIAVMEVVDNSVMWLVPGAMDAPLSSLLFWGAMAFSLVVALFAAWPVNRWLLARGRGHARVHSHHMPDGSRAS